MAVRLFKVDSLLLKFYFILKNGFINFLYRFFLVFSTSYLAIGIQQTANCTHKRFL